MSLPQYSDLTLTELPELRRKTEALGAFLSAQLTQHLATLRPLLEPARVLGKSHTSGRIAWIERNLAEFKQRYEHFGRPFRLQQEFDTEVIADMSTALDAAPATYLHPIPTNAGPRNVTMTSPTRWTVNYASEYTPARLAAILAGRETGQPEFIREFVLHALLIDLVITKAPAVVSLLKALRLEVTTVPAAALHQLPLVTFQFSLPSFRPPDNLILDATAFSGVPAFIELIDLNAVHQLTDPLKVELLTLIQ